MLQSIYKELCKNGLDSDKGSAHSYIDFYEGLFYPYKTKYNNILEIGIEYGYSCALWKEYFENSTIFGLDINRGQHRLK